MSSKALDKVDSARRKDLRSRGQGGGRGREEGRGRREEEK